MADFGIHIPNCFFVKGKECVFFYTSVEIGVLRCSSILVNIALCHQQCCCILSMLPIH